MTTYPLEKQARALSLIAAGSTYRAAADELGVSYSTVYRWLHPEYAARVRALSNAAKKRRRGRCVDCGAPTAYAGKRSRGVGPLATSRRCEPCGRAQAIRTLQARRGFGPTQQRILAFCETPRRYMDIANQVCNSNGHASQALWRLLQYGLVVRVRRGVYQTAAVRD